MSNSAGAPIQQTVGASFVPQASAAPRNASAPFDALSDAAGAGLRLADVMQTASDQHAYNQAGLATRKSLDDLKIQYAQDPDPATAADRFETDAQKLVNQQLGTLPQTPDLRNKFADEFGLHVEALRSDVKMGAVKQLNDEGNASTEQTLNDTAARMPFANAADRVNLATQASTALKGAVTSHWMTAKQAQTRGTKWRSDVDEYDVQSLIRNNPNSAIAALNDPARFPNLDPVKRIEYLDHADAEVRQQAREARVQQTADRADIRASLGDVQTQMNAGLPVDPTSLASLQSRVTAMKDPMLANRMDTIAAQATVQDKLRGATPGEVDSVVDNLTQAGAANPSPKVAAALQSARNFRTRMQEGLKSDSLTWASSQGTVKLQPLALNGTDTPDAWRARQIAGDTVARTYGRPPQYLTGSEANTLKTQLKSADPATKLTLAQTLINGLGDHATSAFAQIAPQDSVWAQAGALSLAGKHDAATDALRGQSLLAAHGTGKTADLAPSKTARDGATGSPLVNDAFRFAPQLGSHVLATADAIFAARAAQRGMTGKNAEDSADGQALYARSVQEAAGAGFTPDGTQYGGVVQYHGKPVAAPATIKADDFESIVKGLGNANTLTRASLYGGLPQTSDGKPLTDLSNAYLIAVGDGRYVVSTTDPDSEPHLLHDAKAPKNAPAYVLDLHKVLPWMNPSSANMLSRASRTKSAAQNASDEAAAEIRAVQ